MNQIEREAVERVAESMLKESAEIAIDGAALSKEGYDTELLRELIDTYGRLPDAQRRFDFRTEPAVDGRSFSLRIRRRNS